MAARFVNTNEYTIHFILNNKNTPKSTELSRCRTFGILNLKNSLLTNLELQFVLYRRFAWTFQINI